MPSYETCERNRAPHKGGGCSVYMMMRTEDDPAPHVPDTETFRQRIARASLKRSAESFQRKADALIEESRRNPAAESVTFSEEEIQELGKVLNMPVSKVRDLCE